MRLAPASENHEFGRWLDTLPYDPSLRGRIDLPTGIGRVTDTSDLCHCVYSQALLKQTTTNLNVFHDRSILALRHEIVTEFNYEVLQRFPGVEQKSNSVNTADINDKDGVDQVLVEFLQSIDLPSIPPSQLHLKQNVAIILLRNLNPELGLCNGSRMTVAYLGNRCLEVKMLGGDYHGETQLIPRILLTTKEGDLSYVLSRRQFPVRLCFAMTVNKSPGQSFRYVGVDLRRSLFVYD